MQKEKWKAAAGVDVFAAGACFKVEATERIVSATGLVKAIGGLFITAPTATLPDALAA